MAVFLKNLDHWIKLPFAPSEKNSHSCSLFSKLEMATTLLACGSVSTVTSSFCNLDLKNLKNLTLLTSNSEFMLLYSAVANQSCLGARDTY